MDMMYRRYMSLTAFIIISFVLLYYSRSINYLMAHTVVELANAAIAITLFSAGWRTRQHDQYNFIIILSIGYLLVGILTIFHVLSFEGMGIFQQGTIISTQFWSAANYVGSIALLTALLYLNKTKTINKRMLLCIVLFGGFLIILSLFNKVLTQSFNYNELIRFKIIGKYVVSVILTLSGFILWKRRNLFENDVLIIFLAISFSILSNISVLLNYNSFEFLEYTSHLLMFLSISYIYIFLFKDTLRSPYHFMFNHTMGYINELELIDKEIVVKDYAMDSSLNGIILVDLDGKLQYANKSFLKLLGYVVEKEVLGLPALDIFDNSNNIDMINAMLIKKDSWQGEITIRKKDGSLIDSYLMVNYVSSKEGNPICIMASVMDVAFNKKADLKLIQTKKDAVIANKDKNNFLARMSHEIRTPMNGIKGFLHLLENTKINDQQIEYIHRIKTSSDILLTMINDILDVSIKEAGRLKLDRTSFNLREMVEQVIKPLKIKAKEKGLNFKIEIDNYIPRFVLGDPARLGQVIKNIICNAVKFTNKGYILLEIKQTKKHGTSREFRFSIKDTGIGMNQEVVNKIFTPFFQGDVSSTREYGGMGLGLAICKSIIDLMEGNIQIESTLGKGTTLIFTVLLEVSEDVYHLRNKSNFNQSKLNFSHYNKLRVLLVEDNEINRVLLINLLKTKKIECDIAVDGLEAVNACLNNKYDLIFMDCQMPVMDGYEATRNIRKGSNHPIIIAITANTQKGDDKKCLAAGMNDYLNKPIDIHQLSVTLEKYIKQIKLTRNKYNESSVS